MNSWNNLDQAVMSGQPIRGRATHSDPSRRESFLMGMFNMGMLTAPKLADHLDLSNHHRLLDLGGGPGAFAIHFCRQNPHLEAIVFDLPGTEQFARNTIQKSGLADRVDFVAGDFHKDDYPKNFDVAWLSHILHAEGPEQCREILSKTVAVLEKGGEIIIHEFILNDHENGPLFPALFSLNMLLRTERGRSYSQSQLIDMLKEAGVTDIRRTEFVGPTESGIIIGKIP